MKSSSLAVALIWAVGLVLIHICQAQNSAQDFLSSHNAARSQVGVGPLEWGDTVAAYAEEYANKRAGDCQLTHSGGPYGENIFMGSGPDFTAVNAVDMWVGEAQYYDHGSNSCTQGEVCGHYTQVVWRDSVRLGCARVECNNGGTFITCNYDPPGNVEGQSPY